LSSKRLQEINPELGIRPRGTEGDIICREYPPWAFLSLGILPFAAKLDLSWKVDACTLCCNVGLHPAVLEGTIRPQGALDHCGLQEGETEPKPKHWSARTTHLAIVTGRLRDQISWSRFW